MQVKNSEQKVVYFSVCGFGWFVCCGGFFVWLFFLNLCSGISFFFNTESSITIIKMTWKASLILFFSFFLFYKSDPLYLHGVCKAVCQLNKLSKPSAQRLLEVNNVDLKDLVIHSKSQLYF